MYREIRVMSTHAPTGAFTTFLEYFFPDFANASRAVIFCARVSTLCRAPFSPKLGVRVADVDIFPSPSRSCTQPCAKSVKREPYTCVNQDIKIAETARNLLKLRVRTA